MLPVLAGYIFYSIAGKPGPLHGFLGGYLSGQVKAGFLEAILIGLVAGYVVEAPKKVRVSKYLRPIMPILLIPIISGRGRIDDQGTSHPHCTNINDARGKYSRVTNQSSSPAAQRSEGATPSALTLLKQGACSYCIDIVYANSSRILRASNKTLFPAEINQFQSTKADPRAVVLTGTCATGPQEFATSN
ncbi:MAG TPA: hypothetical protein VG206_10085 [Terriglobia bacterium]|nr:hypothetical protein [Terriglobia bacterium]